MKTHAKEILRWSVANSLEWIMGLTMIGILLLFLGLVHRQPVLKHGEDTSPPEPA